MFFIWDECPVIDAHCHLDLYPDPAAVVRKSVDRGVNVVSVTTTPAAWNGTKRLADGLESIITALGMHPQLVASRPRDIELFDGLVNEASWLGEIGLDGSPEYRDSMLEQVKVFRHVLKTSTQAGGRVMSIHTRGAARAVLDVLETHPNAGTPVLHWFSGSPKELREAIKIGCWFSCGEPMMQSKRGVAHIQQIPKDRLLTESDGPFVQHQGKPAYPWDMESVERLLSEIWQLPIDNVQERLRKNWKRISKQ